MKKTYLRIEIEILPENFFTEVLLTSPQDNFITDELYEEIIL